MASKTVKRCMKDARNLLTKGSEKIVGYSEENNIRRFYCLIEGFEDTDYEGGHFIFEIFHDESYPFKAPSIKCLTPTGRFYVNTKLCFNFSDFHQESWSPAWDTEKICTAIISSMIATDINEFGSGHYNLSSPESKNKKYYTKDSRQYNRLNHPVIYDKLLVLLAQKKEKMKKK